MPDSSESRAPFSEGTAGGALLLASATAIGQLCLAVLACIAIVQGVPFRKADDFTFSPEVQVYFAACIYGALPLLLAFVLSLVFGARTQYATVRGQTMARISVKIALGCIPLAMFTYAVWTLSLRK